MEILDSLVKLPVNMNKVDFDGRSPLHIAVSYGNTSHVKSVIRAGADVNRSDLSGCTALIREVLSGLIDQKDKMNLLLREGANAKGETALMLAACRGQTDQVNVLLEAGADVNKSNSRGETALMLVTSYLWNSVPSHLKFDIMKALLRAGADVNKVDDTGETALMSTVSYGHAGMVNALLEAGADVNKSNSSGETALMSAIDFGNAESINLLLKAGADVNIADDSGRTPLMINAAYRKTDMANTLIKFGADVNKISTGRFTVLSISASGNDVEGVRLMLRSGAKVNLGRTPFSRCLLGKVNKLLIAAGTRINKMITSLYSEQASFARHTLQNQCRITIRQHLMKLDRHGNLFHRVPRIGLPSPIARYLLYGVSLDDDDDEDDDDDSFGYEPLLFQWCQPNS